MKPQTMHRLRSDDALRLCMLRQKRQLTPREIGVDVATSKVITGWILIRQDDYHPHYAIDTCSRLWQCIALPQSDKDLYEYREVDLQDALASSPKLREFFPC